MGARRGTGGCEGLGEGPVVREGGQAQSRWPAAVQKAAQTTPHVPVT